MHAMNPSITNATLQDRRQRVVASGNASAIGQYIAKGNGAILTDVEGNEYIDFAGGIAVMNVGHSHPKVVAAAKRQAAEFTHTCFMVSPRETAIRLAEKLCQAVPCRAPQAVMFANSGAEAVENAVKIARYHTGKSGIIAFENAFHGRTLMGMSPDQQSQTLQVACAAALAVINIFETEDLLARSKALGKVLQTRLEQFKQDYEIVGDVRGIGPMMALELVKDRHTKIPAAEEAKSLTAF